MRAIAKTNHTSLNFPPNIRPDKTYWVIGIEYELWRVINDDLDPVLIHPIFFDILDYHDVINWQQTITDEYFYFTPKIFAQYPYFWEVLHDGDGENSLQYADIYMVYLADLLGKQELCQCLESLYLQSINADIPYLSFWQKQWLKHVFGVTKAIELRHFDATFQPKIKQYLEKIT